MREILFRGKCVGSGEWIYGNLNYYPDINRAFIRLWPDENKRKDTLETEVLKDTVGQYTGMCDKNGRKIFEGDIIELTGDNFFIVFVDGCFRLSKNTGYFWTLHNLYSAIEVIGNVYDNPELLKGGEG